MLLVCRESKMETLAWRPFCMDMRKTAWLQTVACVYLFLWAAPNPLWAQSKPMPIGTFENHGDVGTVLHPGSVEYDASKKTYIISGSGENMWLKADALQFVWKQVSGDVTLTADISILSKGGNEHKKAVLMIRQSLDADSAYADVALHASGLASLQYRDEKGAMTHEVQSNVNNHFRGVTKSGTNETPFDFISARLRLTRRGSYVYMSQAATGPGRTQHYDGESIRIPLEGEFYVGIGVCSHDKDTVEEATFSNVEIKPLPSSSGEPVLYSTLETVEVESTDRRVVYFASGRFEAPNWARDGSYLLFNRNGHLEKFPLTGEKQILQIIDTGFADHLNNDHGISPDATQLAISDN